MRARLVVRVRDRALAVGVEVEVDAAAGTPKTLILWTNRPKT